MLWIINFNCWQIVLRVELRCRGVVSVMELDIYSNPRGNPFLWPLQKAASCPYPAYFFSAWRKVIKGTGSPTYLISFRLKTVMNITQPVNIYLHILFRKHKQVWYIYIYMTPVTCTCTRRPSWQQQLHAEQKDGQRSRSSRDKFTNI